MQSKVKAFQVVDAKNRPMLEACVDCADIAGRLRPAQAEAGDDGLKVLIAAFKVGPGHAADPSFREELGVGFRWRAPASKS